MKALRDQYFFPGYDKLGRLLLADVGSAAAVRFGSATLLTKTLVFRRPITKLATPSAVLREIRH